MIFSEANRKFKIFHTSHKKALNNISWGCVIFRFYMKKNPLKFHSNHKYLVSYRDTGNYFNK